MDGNSSYESMLEDAYGIFPSGSYFVWLFCKRAVSDRLRRLILQELIVEALSCRLRLVIVLENMGKAVILYSFYF